MLHFRPDHNIQHPSATAVLTQDMLIQKEFRDIYFRDLLSDFNYINVGYETRQIVINATLHSEICISVEIKIKDSIYN